MRNKYIKYILILIICIGVSMSITKFSPEDISGLAERLQRLEQDIKNLKMERKVYFSDAMKGEKWIEWTPVFGAEMPMSFTVVDYVAEYCIIEGVVIFHISATGTTSGTSSPAIYFTVPTEVGFCIGGACNIADPIPTRKAGFWVLGTATRMEVYRYDESNWGIGSDRRISVQGFYKMAE